MNVEGRHIVFEIWDTAGQERFMSLTHVFFKGANAAIFVIDLTRRDSLGVLASYSKALSDHCAPGSVVIVLAANKSDLAAHREVSDEDCQQQQRALQALAYFECSAQTGENITDIFDTIARSPSLQFVETGAVVIAKEKEDKCAC
jgi:small GTP-binding protein